jgi:hypothetical protein
MRASLAGLDEGTFTEAHELDNKWSETGPIHNGRLPCGFS